MSSGGSGWFDLAGLIGTAIVTGWFTLRGVRLGQEVAAKHEAERRRREVRAHWTALHTEITACAELAMGYLLDNVDIPSYRLPTVAYEHSLPRLLAEPAPTDLERDPTLVDSNDPMVALEVQAISDLELQTIEVFYRNVAALNRGLDYAHHAPEGSNLRRVEIERVCVKAVNLISGKYVRRHGRLHLDTYDWLMSMVSARVGTRYPIESVLATRAPQDLPRRLRIRHRLLRFEIARRRRDNWIRIRELRRAQREAL